MGGWMLYLYLFKINSIWQIKLWNSFFKCELNGEYVLKVGYTNHIGIIMIL